MPVQSSKLTLRHWSLIIPIVALAGFLTAWLVHVPTPPRSLDIQLTPPAQAELADIPLPARVRMLAGTVVEPDGTPAADALVWVLSGDEPRWTYTDEHGAFRLEHLQRGPWDVRVLAHDHLPWSVALRDLGAPQELRLPDARRPPPRLADVHRASLSGTIVAGASVLLDGTEVVLSPVLAPEEIDAPVPRRVQADPQGRFTVPDLIAGEYRVEVLPAWARGGTWPDLARALDSAEPRRFTHRDDGSSPLTIELASGDLRGELADFEGLRPEGALVLVWPAGRPERPWPPARTDARGGFVVRGLPAGRYALSARSGEHAWTREVAVPAGSDVNLGTLAASAPAER